MTPTKMDSLTAERLLRLFASLQLARHGNAPEVEGIPSRNKPLSEKGRQQASATADKIAAETFDFIGSSPLNRAKETTRIMTGSDSPVIIDSLDISDDPTDPLNVMFAALKYSPLSAYFAHELGDHLKAWAFDALAEIVEKVSAVRDHGVNVFIGGHAVCQPAVAWAIGEIITEGDPAFALPGEILGKAMLELNLGEGEVIAIDMMVPQDLVIFRILKP